MDYLALYDSPVIIAEFAGGPWAGHRMPIPDDRDTYMAPVPPEISITDYWPGIPDLSPVKMVRYRKYRIADDGTRWFRPDH